MKKQRERRGWKNRVAWVLAFLLLSSWSPAAAWAALAVPVFEKDLPDRIEYNVGQPAEPLQVSVQRAESGGSLNWQWYKVEGGEEGIQPIQGATTSSYTPPTDEAGTVYYFVRVTRSRTGESSASADSNYLEFCVVEKEEKIYSVEVNETLGNGSLDRLDVAGADVAAHSVQEDGNNRDYTFYLPAGTPDDTEMEVRFHLTQIKSFPIASSMDSNDCTGIASTYLSQIQAEAQNSYAATIERGQGTAKAYVYSTLPEIMTRKPRIYTFHFIVEDEDLSNDPDPDQVQSLSITVPPAKTSYVLGEFFNKAGMVVTAALTTGDTAEVKGYTWSPDGQLQLGDSQITVSYGGHTAVQPISVAAAAKILDAEVKNGQFVLENSLYDQGEAHIVTWYGEQKTQVEIQVPDGAQVFAAGSEQTVAGGTCVLELEPSTEEDGKLTEVKIKAGALEKTYRFYCHLQSYDGMPQKVVDYLCPASQYTNGNGLGPYGLAAVATLLGGDGTVSGLTYKPPASLGNFGGYLTYYYEQPITDDPNNPYGVDFMVYGNSYNGTNGFAEPGNVLVSEDGSTWYTLAGSLHYDLTAVWGYQVTYEKNDTGTCNWSDNKGDSGVMKRFTYPLSKNYLLHPWTADMDTKMTLTGTYLMPESELNEYGNTLPPYPAFGYADCGVREFTDQASNPYLGGSASNGFDLAWAVDDQGLPVTFPNGIQYIKVQTANMIDNGSIGEKSTELNGMRLARPAAAAVGRTDAPQSIRVGETDIALQPDVFVYDAQVSGAYEVQVDTASPDANVFINDQRGSSRSFGGAAPHGIIRIIVQEGQKEPVIYYIKTTETTSVKTTAITFNAAGGTVEGNAKIIRYYDENTENKTFPVPTRAGYTFLGWNWANKYYTEFQTGMPEQLTMTASWKDNSAKPSTGKKIGVSFRLIGATLSPSENVDIGKGINDSEYVTWIATRNYSLDEGSTVYDLFVMALSDAGLTADGQDKNYVTTIYAPDVVGGYKLSEFTNGPYSGWMYTVNGEHPTEGLRKWELKDKDTVVWHYVNDYRYEVHDWDKLGGPGFPALGNSSTWSKWLNAKDQNPTKDSPGVGGGSGVSGGTATETDGKTTASSTVSVTGSADSSGKAEVKVKSEDISKALSQAAEAAEKAKNDGKKDVTAEVRVDVKIEGRAAVISAEIPTSSLKEVAGQDTTFTVKTVLGDVSIPAKALTEAAKGASGSTMILRITQVEAGEDVGMNQLQRDVVGDRQVFEVALLSGGKKITEFGGNTISISLPYALADGEKAAGVMVKRVLENGELVDMKAVYDATAKTADFEADSLAYFVVGYDKTATRFVDVKEGHWFYEAVTWLADQGIVKGTGAQIFSPDANITRAEFVQILYNRSGTDSGTEILTSGAMGVSTDKNTAPSFIDVKSDAWYAGAVSWAGSMIKRPLPMKGRSPATRKRR